MSEIAIPEQERRVGFPWDTELVYTKEPEGVMEFSDAAQSEFVQRNERYQQEIQHVLLQGKDSSFFSPEDQHAIEQVELLFHRLITATLPEDRDEIRKQLGEIDAQTKSSHALQIKDTSHWFPRTYDRPDYNMLYSNEIISLVNAHVALLKESYEGKALQAQLAKFFISLEGLPQFQQSSARKKKESAQDDFNFKGTVMDIKGALLTLEYLRTYESEEMFDSAKQDLANMIGSVRQRLEFAPEQLQAFNESLHTILEDRRGHGSELRYKGTETKEAVDKRNAEARQKLIEKKIAPYLCNTEEYIVFMHRTQETTAEKISETGFATSDLLESTATASRTDQEEAIDIFSQRHRGDTAVVLIRVPRNQRDSVDDQRTLPRELWGSEGEENMTAVIPPSWIVGYVRRSDTELVRNEHFGDTAYDARKPKLRSW